MSGKRLTDTQMKKVVLYDIFDGEETPRRYIFDKIVVPRRDHICQNCCGPVVRGDHSRAAKILWTEEGTFWVVRWCFDCCEALGSDGPGVDGFQLLCDRYDMFAEKKEKGGGE